MTDKEKILAEIERLINELGEQRDINLEDLRDFINSLPEEPVSKDLELAATKYAQDKYMPVQTSQAFKAGAKWKEAKDQEITETAIHHAYHNGRLEMKEQIMKNIWKPADGDDLPEIDREVIAILDYDFGHYKVVYAHRPNPNGWNGTNIDTEEKEHFEPEIYDKGGWNQPHVLYWLDTKLPYEEK